MLLCKVVKLPRGVQVWLTNGLKWKSSADTAKNYMKLMYKYILWILLMIKKPAWTFKILLRLHAFCETNAVIKLKNSHSSTNITPIISYFWGLPNSMKHNLMSAFSKQLNVVCLRYTHFLSHYLLVLYANLCKKTVYALVFFILILFSNGGNGLNILWKLLNTLTFY